MNQVYLQLLLVQLKRRFEQLSESKDSSFYQYLIMFWNFIQSPPFNNIIDNLACLYSEIEIEKKFRDIECGYMISLYGETYQEHTALAYFIIKECLQRKPPEEIVWRLGNYYYCLQKSKPLCSEDENVFLASLDIPYQHLADSINAFISNVVRPLYEYINESLEENTIISYFLVRYKHRSEWFQRKNLEKLYKEDTKKGEKNLCLNLYEYLFEQGIEFSIEPSSISGEADLVLDKNSDNPLIADAKIFDGDSRDKSYLLKGFRQIYQYTLDYNQPFGYLIIFKICEEDLKFEVAQNNQLVPCVVHNNKTIFFLTIDIYPHEKSASQRPKLKSYIIKESELIKEMEIEQESK